MNSIQFNKNLLITFVFLLLVLSVTLSLSSIEGVSTFSNSSKYIFLAVFSLVLSLLSNSYSVSKLPFLSYIFFLWFVLLFTAINYPDLASLMTVFGYFLLLMIWVSIQSRTGIGWFLQFVKTPLMTLVALHVLFSIFLLFDTNSFTVGKGQFLGYMNNPNAYAGVTGLLLVLLLSKSIPKISWHRFLYLMASFFLFVFSILSGSRGVMLSLGVVFFLSNFNALTKLLVAAVVFLAIFLFYVTNIIDNYIGIDILTRDLLENTGRSEMAVLYFNQIFDASILVGTGLSEQGGRFKTELSYFDVWLFSGIGAIGFLVFVMYGLYCSYKIQDRYGMYLFPVMVYIAVLSIFEGYISNVVSNVTFVFYIIHGVSSHFHERGLPYTALSDCGSSKPSYLSKIVGNN